MASAVIHNLSSLCFSFVMGLAVYEIMPPNSLHLG